MHTLPNQIVDLYNHLIQTSDKATALLLIEEYFSLIPYEEAKSDLWRLLAGALSSDHLPDAQAGSSRHEMLFFYEFTMVLLAAIKVVKEGVLREERIKCFSTHA